MSYQPPYRVEHLVGVIGEREPISLGPRATVLEALRLMAEQNVGSVLVVEDGRLLGIYTERDYARKGELQGRSAKETLLAEVMSTEVITATPKTLVHEIMLLMKVHDIRHIPIVEGDKILGLVSNKALVKGFADNKVFWDTLAMDLMGIQRS